MSARRGIVVLGMHRSGTSCVGGVLHAMGAYFGARDIELGGNEENPHGFWERKDFNWVCEFALLAEAANWDSPPLSGAVSVHSAKMLADAFTHLRVELDAHAPWFIKDPRLCILLPALLAQLDDAVFVHVVRDPFEIAQSLSRRNGLSMAHALALWELHCIHAFAATRNRPRCIVDYAALFENPALVAGDMRDALAKAGLSGLAVPEAHLLARIVDPALRRERHRPSMDALNAVQADLYQAIQTRSILGESTTRDLSEQAHAELERYQGRRATLQAGRSPTSTGAVAKVREQIVGKLLDRGFDALAHVR